jgi:hypothetical protein
MIDSAHTEQFKVVPFNTRGVRNYLGDWELSVGFLGTPVHSGFAQFVNVNCLNCTAGLGGVYVDVATVGYTSNGGFLDVLGLVTLGNNGSGGAGARAINYVIEYASNVASPAWQTFVWPTAKGTLITSGQTTQGILSGVIPGSQGTSLIFRMKVSDLLAIGGVYAQDRFLRVLETY